MLNQRQFIISLVWISVLATTCASDSDSFNIPSTSVLIQFDLVVTDDWTDEVVNEFKKKIAEYATDFCEENVTMCQVQNTRFSSSDVEIASGYPMDEDVNTLLLFKLNFPSSKTDQEGNTNLNQASLIAIVTHNRKQLQADLIEAAKEPYEASYRISFVNNVLVLEMGDQTLNGIIIPIVCSVVVIMAAVIIGLEMMKKKKMKKQMKMLEQKFGKSEPLLKN